jgi:hypothetical protein
VRARYKPLAQLEAKAKERLDLAAAWYKVNEAAVDNWQRLRFAYAATPAHKIPTFVMDQAAGMVKHSCRALGLDKVAILWLEWALHQRQSRSVCFVMNHPIQGLCISFRARERSRAGFESPGMYMDRAALLAAHREVQSAKDAILIRWDIPGHDRLFTIAHEIKHLWFAYNDQGQSCAEEEAACNEFARESMRARGIK